MPSARAIRAGKTSGYAFVPEAKGESDGVRLRAQARDYLGMLDLRQVVAGGPLLPLILLAALNGFQMWDQQAFGLLLPEIKASFGFSVQFLVTIGSLVVIANTLIAPLMGYAADRISRVWMLRIGALVSHASIAVTGLAPTLPGMAASRFANGLGASLTQPTGLPLLGDYYKPDSRARVFAILTIAGVLGAMIAPTVAGFLAANVGWRSTLFLLGSILTLASLSFFFLKEPVRGSADRRAMGADEAAALRAQRPVSWSEGWRAAASISTVRRFWIIQPLVTILGSGVVLVGLYYQQKFHLGPAARGLIATLSGIPVILVLPFSGAISDRLLAYKPGKVMTYAGLVMMAQAASLVVFARTPYLWLAVIVGLVPSVAASLLIPTIFTLFTLVVPARIRGLGAQTTAPFIVVGLVLGIVVSGYADSAGIDVALTIYGALALVAGIVWMTGASGVERDIRAALAASMADEEARRSRASGRNKMLICRDIDVEYDAAQVLFNVDFDVEEGEIVALLGTNGAGKSTLLRAISGIHQASNGAIFLDGEDITHVPPEQNAAKGIVMMPGGRAVFPTLTVDQNLGAAAWLYRDDHAYLTARRAEVLDLFPVLREKLHVQAGNLSGGEQQMVALSQALLMKPRLLMIDELSLGLARSVVATLLAALRRIHAEGTTVIVVEQSVNVALQIADRAVYMEKGQIRFDGPVRELFGRGDVVRSVFLGRAAASSLGATPGRRFDDPAHDTEALLQTTDLSVSFGGSPILNGISVNVHPEEVVGIVGPNGAGKTTLFDVIAGFTNPSRGRVEFLNRDITHMAPDARARMGMVRSYQNVRLFPALTVRENIAVALERHLEARAAVLAAVWAPVTRRVERRVSRRVDNLIESLGLGAYADKFMNELSTGSRRIVDIACLLAAGPRLLLLDEPSSGLAQAETENLAPVIRRIVKETNCGVLIIEHDLGLIANVSDRLIAMRLGSAIAEGAPRMVLEDPQVVDALLGGSLDAPLSESDALDPAIAGSGR